MEFFPALPWSKPSKKPTRPDTPIRGARLISAEEVQAEYARAELDKVLGDYRLPVGPLRLAPDQAVLGTKIQAAPGHGKTLFMTQMILSALPMVGRGMRLFLFDPKQTFLGITNHYLPRHVPIVNLDLFDTRSWGMTLDHIRTRIDVGQFAATIIAKPDANDPFWHLYARIVLVEVLWTRIQDYQPWTLQTVLNDHINIETIKEVLVNNLPALKAIEPTLDLDKVGPSVVAVLRSEIMKFEGVAALWNKAETKVGLDWLLDPKRQSVIFFNWDHNRSESALPLLQLAFRAFTDRILTLGKQPVVNLFLLDEASLLAKVDLIRLLRLGRFSQCWFVLAYQDVTDMELALGKEQAHITLGLLQNSVFLNPGASLESAAYASKVLGVGDVYRTTNSTNWSESVTNGFKSSSRTYGVGGGTQESYVADVPVVTADELRNSPLTSWADGRLLAHARLVGQNPCKFVWDFTQLKAALSRVPAFAERILRDDGDMILPEGPGF